MPVSHPFVSAIPDDPAAVAAGEVVPSNWNANHTVSIDLTSEVTGVLPVANGGVGATSFTSNAVIKGNATGALVASGVLIDSSNNITGAGTIASGAVTITSATSSSLVVGPNGATNPVLQIDGSAASSITGLKITSGAVGGGVTVTSTSTGTQDPLNINVVGNTTQSALNLQCASVTRLSVTPFQILFTPGGVGTASVPRFGFTLPVQATLTAGTESQGAVFTNTNLQTHASNTAISMQREFRITGSTHAFASSGGVITDAVTLSIDGPPIGGTNATITNAHAFLVQSRALSNVTNGYGITINAPSGAGTINAAINSIGDILVSGNVKLGTAGNGIYIKEGTNGCMGTGTLSGGTLVVSTTKVTANSRIFISDQGGSVTNIGTLYISARSAGTSFTVSSSNVLDASTFAWIIFEPA